MEDILSYKQMVLLEELVDHMSDGSYRMSFMIDDDICVGRFRKDTSDDLKQEGGHSIDLEKLWQDYEKYMEATKEIFVNLTADSKQHPAIAQGEFMSTIFNHAVSFLQHHENQIDHYLTGYDEPGKIYDLHRRSGSVESYSIAGTNLEPFAMFTYDGPEDGEKLLKEAKNALFSHPASLRFITDSFNGTLSPTNLE